MTSEQRELTLAIDCQKLIVESSPTDHDERLVLQSLYTALRNTFQVVPSSTPLYVFSPSGAVLKRV